jgi:hypothetical protein
VRTADRAHPLGRRPLGPEHQRQETKTMQLLAIGTRVRVLADTYGTDAPTGIIIGHVAYAYAYSEAGAAMIDTDRRTEQGYAVELDTGAYTADRRLYLSTMVAHVDSVAPIAEPAPAYEHPSELGQR